MREASVSKLTNVSKVFEVACDTLHVGVGGVLSQEGHPIAFYNKKISEAHQRYLAYDILTQTPKHWLPYSGHREFIHYTDHDSLKHLNAQNKLNARHAHQMDHLQQFKFVIKHKSGTENRVANALSRNSQFLVVSSINNFRFNHLKE